MGNYFNRKFKVISSVLIAALILTALPWRELSADSNTHGEYNAYPFDITYEQNSTWSNSTQGQFTITNTSSEAVTQWRLEIVYGSDVTITNIWDAADVTDYDNDDNITISGNSRISAGGTYTFGLIAEGNDSAPVAPIDVNTVQFISEEPTPTPTPTNIPTPTTAPTNTPTPTNEPTVTNTPAPTPIEEEETVFPYAIFAGSTSDDFSFQGWKSNIVGDIYSGRNFLYQGSELNMEGYARTVGTVQPAGWKTDMTGSQEYIDPIDIPDWSASILAKSSQLPAIDQTSFSSQNSIVANGYYHTDGDLTINSTSFTGDAIIVAKGNITYNVNALSGTGRVLLYSEEGNITINGTEIEINGILYAPQGRVSINAYNTTINGRIVADKFSYNGSILNVTADPADLQLVSELPDVTVTASKSQVNVGQTAYYTIEIPEDNVYEILYRLNGTSVEVTIPDNEEDPVRYDLNTSEAGTYTLEAYVSLPYGTFVLDSDTITVVSQPTATPTNTPTPTATSTPTPTATNTPTPTATPIPTATATPVPTATNTPTPTPEPTVTPTETPTPTAEPTEIPTPTETPAPTEEPTPTITPTETPTPTPTVEPDRYSIFSEGDVSACRYKHTFIRENWDISGRAWMNSNTLSILDFDWLCSAKASYLGTRAFSPDYSLNGRLTISRIDGDGGGAPVFSIIPTDSSVSENSIGLYILPAYNEIRLVINNDLEHPVATGTSAGLSEYGAFNDIWFEYNGQTHQFSVYAAKYNSLGYAVKPEDPILSYEIDLSDKFADSEEFSFSFSANNGWYFGTSHIHGIELDPYPSIHQQGITPTPVPTPTGEPTPTPTSVPFVPLSQGNDEYGYETSFDENTWTFSGEGKYINGDSLSVLDSNTKQYAGDAFLSFAENVGEDYEFYTHFTFTQENVFENGFAFVIEPDEANGGFYGNNGYGAHHNSLIVEFDLSAQNNLYKLNDEGKAIKFNESNSHVGIILNGDEGLHYAVADYSLMRELGSRTDCWAEYDGHTLSVYIYTINKYGHIYKTDKPIVSLDIDLEEYFGGEHELHFGFVGGDYNKQSNVTLNGFEIAKTPFTTLAPDDYPIEEQDVYKIVSMGDLQYGYQDRFNGNEWSGTGTTPNRLTASGGMGGVQERSYWYPLKLSEDYSFAGRITTNIYQAMDRGHYMNFVLSSGYGERYHSVSIHLDQLSTPDSHWRNEFGEYAEGEPDGWYSGQEPYEASIAICLNWDDTRDYAVAEYTPLLTSGAFHEIWFEYVGSEKKLYVYVATYDENNNVTKPDTPLLVCPLDLEEIFEGSHTVYLGTVGKNAGLNNGEFLYCGMEFDPNPVLHNEFTGVLQILAPLDNREYYIGDSIDISGRIGPMADPNTGITVEIKDSEDNTVYTNDGTVSDSFGYIDRITTDDMDPGEYTIVLTVTDEDGNDYVKQIPITLKYQVVIAAEITDSVVTEDGLSIVGNISCNEDSSYELKLLTVNEDEEEEWITLSTGEGNKTQEELGLIPSADLIEGTYTVELIVTSESGKKYETITDVTYTAPVREFTDEELFADIDDELNGADVTYITDITGTVSGTELVDYTFEVFPVDSEEAVYTYTGDEAVEEGTLGTLDPTLLLNGYYRVIVTANAVDGSVSDEIVVLVKGQAKIGNFTMSFLDVTLPVTGLPVEVYRTYDSRQRTQLGDFGYGWTMSIGGPKISVSGNPAEGWGQHSAGSSIGVKYFWDEEYPHEIYVDWGNGHEETFTLKFTPENQFYVQMTRNISAGFDSVNGDTLTILDEHTDLTYAAGILYKQDLEEFEITRVMLTRPDGMKYYFSLTDGLYKVEDTYGRTIEINDSGITYSEGGSITFNRDSDGKITSITDGLGNTVTYTYDSNGNLTNVNDIGGYDTSFSYDDDHYVTEIRSDNGTKVARNEYDDDGRLVATIDADGRRIEFDHDLTNKIETTTDRLQHVTVYEYDIRGNVVKITDPLGRITKYTYDANNNKTSETRPDNTVFGYTYDSQGNLLSATDSQGRTIRSTYEDGRLMTMSAMGVTELELSYDSHGNMTSATDSMGNTQEYAYSNKGELTSVTDNLGTLMSMSYDNNGHVSSITNADGQVTNFTYDSEGRLKTRSITYHGSTRTDTYTYDASNRVTGIRYADENTVSYSYNQAGDVISSTDSQGRTINYTYDIYGNLTKISYPDGTNEQFTYNAEGWNLTAKDRMGRTVTFQYDAVGNVTKKIYPNSTYETYTYDSCDRLISSTNVYGSTTTYGYDYLGRNTSITDSSGNTVRYTYNNRGNVATVKDALNNTYTFTYDNNGNQTSVTYPNGSVFHSTYDVRGRMTSQSDAYGNTTTYSYDGMDRLISVTDALNGTWNYEYDSLGNVTKVTDAKGNETNYGYDNNGQVTSVTNAAGRTATTSYDSYGRVTSVTDFGGTETVYTYDSMDRVATETINGEVTTYTYDSLGNLTSVEDPSGTITYTYNSDGLLTSVTNANGETISYTYNNGYQLSKITIDGQEISYGYDTQGRLITVTDSEGTTRYSYDANGNRVATEYPNGVTTTYTYNSINALISQVSTDSTGAVLTSYEYTIGANGERLSVTELNRTVEYTYDALNRLTSETVTRGTDVSVTSYTYDANSNRLTKTVDGVTTSYTYNSLNQLTQAGDVTYTWDNAGNLISQSSMGTTLATYTYDSRNRMISANVNSLQGTITESYTYDYLGNRTSKTSNGVTTTFTTDLSTGYSQVLKATKGTDTVYYTRGFELISRREGTSASYYLYDGGLSVRALTDEDGVVTDTLVFDAFGNETGRTGTTDNAYGFQGEEKDSTGLYYLRARYMDPSTGTFTSMDTYSGSLSDPVSLHKYLFANANPVMYSDPSGHFSLVEMNATMVINRILDGAMISGLLYTIEAHEKDPELKNHDIFGYLGAILGGALFVVVAMILCASVVGAIALAIVSAVMGIVMVYNGFKDFIAGHFAYGVLEIVLGTISFVFGASTLKEAGGYLRNSRSVGSEKCVGTNNKKINDNVQTVKEHQVRTNYSRGRAFANEQVTILQQSGEYSNIAREVSLVSDNGIRMRADAIAIDNDNNLVIFEFKSSETAQFSRNQKSVFSEISYSGNGAKVIGRNGGSAFPPGYRIEPNTPIKVVRPSGTKLYTDLY